MSYQSFAGQTGNSNSRAKLERIGLPADLSGKRVLDLGCNEGFFCLEAKRRGAAAVVGVDANPDVIGRARERAQAEGLDVTYHAADFMKIRGERFNVILMLSALHYAKQPQALLRRVRQLLAPDGLFILECGVTEQNGRRVRRALRAIDERSFPSDELLRADWLEPFSVRFVTKSVQQDGDPVPRKVFHCTPRKPSLVLISGPGSAGKTTIAQQFKDPLLIETDNVMAPRRNAPDAKVASAQQTLDAAIARSKGHLGRAWDLVRSDPAVVTYFAQVVARMIRLNEKSKLIVVEGVMVADLAPRLTDLLKADFMIWNMTRDLPPAVPPERPTLLGTLRDRLRS
jgi:ubiquinone/menaquinone biosynthesis C-methylase UbiE